MKRRLGRWSIALGALVLLFGIGTMALRHWLGTANTGTVYVGKPSSATSKSAQPLTIKSTYFTTTLPAGFQLRRQTETPTASQTLLQLVADGGTNMQVQFAVTVGILPADGLAGVGDYHLRVATPASYVPFSPVGVPAGATGFRTSTGPAAFTVFEPRATRYTEVTLSTDGGATLAQLQTIYVQAMTAWNWQ